MVCVMNSSYTLCHDVNKSTRVPGYPILHGKFFLPKLKSINELNYFIYSTFVNFQVYCKLVPNNYIHFLHTLSIPFHWKYISYCNIPLTLIDPSKSTTLLSIFGWFIENKRRLQNSFTIVTYQVKFNYTNVANGHNIVLINQRCKQLLCCRIYLFIAKMSKFINIDLNCQNDVT